MKPFDLFKKKFNVVISPFDACHFAKKQLYCSVCKKKVILLHIYLSTNERKMTCSCSKCFKKIESTILHPSFTRSKNLKMCFVTNDKEALAREWTEIRGGKNGK